MYNNDVETGDDATEFMKLAKIVSGRPLLRTVHMVEIRGHFAVRDGMGKYL